MATVTPGITFVSGETVTPAKLNSAATPTISAIQTADISDNQITTAKIVDANVTDAKLATGAVTGAAGGGKLAASAINSQTVIADPLAATDEFLVWDASASALRKISWSSMQPNGTVLQTVYAEDDTYQTATGQIPYDDTLPTSTEGTEILTASITPTSATSKVLVRCCVPMTTMSTARGAAWALFHSTTCIQFAVGNMYTAANTTDSPVHLEVMHSPASTSAQTYSLRVGPAFAADTVRLNGDSARKYGGACKITLVLQEIKA